MSCPLSFATAEKQLKIVNILGGDKSRSRLQDKGFCIGDCVCVKKGSCRGDIILQIKNSKYAVGFGLANKIIVDEL